MDTERLLERAQSGDTSAVDQLLRTHYSAIHSVCHRMLLSRESADDAVQNALIAIVKGLPRFDGKAALSTWIYRIATNSAIDEKKPARAASAFAFNVRSPACHRAGSLSHA